MGDPYQVIIGSVASRIDETDRKLSNDLRLQVVVGIGQHVLDFRHQLAHLLLECLIVVG